MGIITNNLTIGYQNPVLSDVNLSLNKGEILCVLGKNGSGKTTLISLVLNLISKWKEGNEPKKIKDFYMLPVDSGRTTLCEMEIFPNEENVKILIDALEEKGFVIRKRGIVDRRSFSIHLTDLGHSVISTHKNLIKESEREALRNLSKDEISIFYSLLNKIA